MFLYIDATLNMQGKSRFHFGALGALRGIVILVLALTGCKTSIINQAEPDRVRVTLSTLCKSSIGCDHKTFKISADLIDAIDKPNLSRFIVRTSAGENVPFQWIDTNFDGVVDELIFSAKENVSTYFLLENSEESKTSFSPQVQLVLSKREQGTFHNNKLQGGQFVDVDNFSIPKWHGPGSQLIRMEGPAWESAKVGYRLYLDKRLTTDIFGKAHTTLALQDVGFDGDDYHVLNPWGADILKVGNSLGIGAVGLRTQNGVRRLEPTGDISAYVLQNGPLLASFKVVSKAVLYQNQNVDITTQYEIVAGSRLTKVAASSSKKLSGWATGIVNHPNTVLVQSDKLKPWSYIATFGKQSVFGDAIGMAIFFPTKQASYTLSDTTNHIVAFNENSLNATYYFSATWAADVDGITSLDAFKRYLEDERSRLSDEPDIKVVTNSHKK